MRTMNRSVGVVAGCWVLVSVGVLCAQDWPQWRGANRDGKVTGFNVPDTWPKALVEKWRTTVGSGDATPALVDDKLYVFTRQGDDEVLMCLSAADGKKLWENKYPAKPVTGPSARDHSGPRSSPTVAEGSVVTLGATGVVSCVKAADGEKVWRNEDYKKVPQFYTSTSPIVVDGMAVVQLGGSGAGTTVAFDMATGNPKWKWEGDGPGYASPVLMTADGVKQIVTLTDKNVVGLAAADGKVLWKIPFVPARMSYNAATPIVEGDTVIFTGRGRGTKAVKVEKEGDQFATSEIWSNPQLAPQFNSPVLKEGLLFGLNDQGSFYCIDAKTGKTAWTDKTKHGRGFCSLVDAGPVFLALPADHELIAFKADGKEYSELAKFQVSGKQTYAHPVVAGQRIFVKDTDAVTMWTLE